MERSSDWPLRAYLGFVALAGFGLLLTVDLATDLDRIGHAPVVFGLFAAGVLLGELLPIKVPGKDDEVTTSTCFMYALLLAFGLGPALLVQGIASAMADLTQRKSPLSIAFNVGQLILALTAADAVLRSLSDLPLETLDVRFTLEDMPALLVAGAVFFALNNLLAGAAWAFATKTPIVSLLREDVGFQTWTAALLLGFAPIVVAVSSYGLFLVPLLLLPVLAVHRGGREARLSEWRSLHDRLTELPNRVLFHDRAQRSIAAARRQGKSVAVMIMDLDRFKEVNDTLGHHHGDLLLQEVGPRLAGVLRDSDTVGRMGGDEFAVLLPDIGGADDALGVADKLLEELGRPFLVGGVTLNMQASIGIASFPEHGDDVDILLQRADVAMYVAKASHTHVEHYASEQDPYSKDRLALVAELRRALEERQLLMHYQPQVDLSTGRLSGVEALVRWEHPTRGMLYPDTFIPLAEMTGMISRVTVEALRITIAQCARWRAEGLDVVVSANVSSRDLLDQDLPARVGELLDEHGVPANRLMLEITESMLMVDPERARRILADLSARGIQIAVDDFGTGYSSLAYLKRLPIDKIKIDRSFVMGMAQDESDRHIVESTVTLGRNLGLGTVAEGVEDGRIYERLASMGCEQAQGYHLSRPLNASQLAGWARDLVDGAFDPGGHAAAGRRPAAPGPVRPTGGGSPEPRAEAHGP